MESTLYAIAALLAWVAANCVYCLAMALVGRSFGIVVREIVIGYGPTVFSISSRKFVFRIAALPLGGYTKFLGHGEPETEALTWLTGESLQGKWSDAKPFAQILTVLSGPLAAILLGLLCLAAPIWLGSRPLEVRAPSESTVQPSGVPGLILGDEPTDWESQWELFRCSAVEFTIRLATFQSLDGWGGGIAYFVTSGVVGELSFEAWLSCIGVLLVWVGTMNLLPLPCLNGFAILCGLWRAVTGRQLPERLEVWLIFFGFVAVLVLFGRAVWLDLRWLWDVWAG